jgi:two-component system CheB/CheR fusion protein
LDKAIVTTAGNAIDALEILGREKVDILVSDISMPEIDGYEFIRRVRKQPELIDLPAIAVSGLGSEKDVNRALQEGFSAHLCKPISVEKLCFKISTLL